MKKLFIAVPLLLVIVVGAIFILWQNAQIRKDQSALIALRKERDYARFQAEIEDYGLVRMDNTMHDTSYNRFYYIENAGPPNSSRIYRYDYAEDTSFQNGGRINVSPVLPIYLERLEKDYEFRLLDLVDGEIIFYKTSTDDSPGPCFSPWIGGYELFSAGVYSTNNLKYPYTVSPEKRKSEEESMRQCQLHLNDYQPLI